MSSWVLEVDIKAFFDHVSHELIRKALAHQKMPKWVLLYCQRWLRAPLVETADETSWMEREVGTPQGGVISPLLVNLFLHYVLISGWNVIIDGYDLNAMQTTSFAIVAG